MYNTYMIETQESREWSRGGVETDNRPGQRVNDNGEWQW